MKPLETLHYAIGEVACTVAHVNGDIHALEARKFMFIMTNELNNAEHDFDVSEIIFDLITRQKTNAEKTYNKAMKEIRQNSQYFSPQLKEKFVKVIDEITKEYPPVTYAEINILERFKKEIYKINC